MALPKGKISKARKHSRRANWKLTVPGIVECPQCHQMKLAHRVCKHCGFYKGRAGRCGQRGKERLIGIRGQMRGGRQQRGHPVLPDFLHSPQFHMLAT